MAKNEINLWLRKSDNHFPCYQWEVDQAVVDMGKMKLALDAAIENFRDPSTGQLADKKAVIDLKKRREALRGKTGVEKYMPVLGIEDENDRKMQRLGNWTVPDVAEGEAIYETIDGKDVIVGHKAGVMTAYRHAGPRSPEEIASILQEEWTDVRNKRAQYLHETDILVLRILEDRLPSTVGKDIRDYRQALRNVTKPDENGVLPDPANIELQRFVDD